MNPDPLAAVVARMERERIPFLARFCPRCHREYESGHTCCYRCREEDAALRLHDALERLTRHLRQPLPALPVAGPVREASGLSVGRVREHGTFIAPTQ